MGELAFVPEADILAELQRRGWVFRERSIPVGTSPYPGEPKIVVRELLHKQRVEEAPHG